MKARDDPADIGLLEEGLDALGLLETVGNGILHNNATELLWTYIKEIELFNEAYGLVKVCSRKELIVKHILDSLAPLERMHDTYFRLFPTPHSPLPTPQTVPGTAIADVGSGAGLPGIPLAICLPEAEFTLIERMGRRAGFLRNCVAVLGLPNVRVEELELEKAVPGRFDLAVFRAFRPLTPEILKGLTAILKPGGVLAAWKGRLENARQEITAVENYVASVEIIPLTVPFLGEERCLTVISAKPRQGSQETEAGAEGSEGRPFLL
ncbi:MAG: 16S rRNA (guanine(527)-N(7))-methyltransferase RsmG [Treponema sp.]|jgi:16S rRNA (guanine527-N7)-methyltransferase|nr:16S rRNA (guanine(527)-N(7))-methyltransferase RsmG [Treponema sp.]